jgi:autotransporter-associated beta strand protein
LSGLAGNVSFIRGGIIQTGDAADMTVNGGTWNHEVGISRIGDVVNVTGATTELNLNSGLLLVRNDFTVTAGAKLNLRNTGVLAFNTPTLSADASLRATAGGVINLGVSDAIDPNQFDGLRIGVDADGADGVLNMGSFNQTVTEFILGNRQLTRAGLVSGTGTLTVTGNLDLYEGVIEANLASTGTTAFEKVGGNETVILKGDNSALTSTGASAIYAGTLVLDYTASNTVKLRELSALDMRGGNLQILGNNTAATTQTVGGLTLANGGANIIEVIGGTGQNAVLNFGGITRNTNANAGTIRFILPSGPQDATNGITTTATLTNGMLGLSGYATVQDATGTYFATTNNGNVVGLASTAKNDVSTWITGDHITDETTGFTGTLAGASLNSLRFNAAAGSDLTLAANAGLGITSGGLLITNTVGATPSMVGGFLSSGATGVGGQELIITQDSAQVFTLSSSIGTNHLVTKSGTGTLLLSGNNTFTGNVDILQGTLQVSGGNGIGDNALVNLDDNRNTTFQLLANETIGRLQGGRRADGEDNGLVALGANTLTLNQSASTTYLGVITGTAASSIVMNAGNTGNLNMSANSSGFTGTVVVKGGLFQLSGSGQNSASSFTVNGLGALLIDNNGGTRSGTRIADTASITLKSASGTFSGQTIPRGLAIRINANATTSETIGNLNFNSGANYLTGEASGTTGIAAIIAGNFVRSNNATVIARGRNLGSTTLDRNQFRIGTAVNETAFMASAANLVGIGGYSTPTVTTTSGNPVITFTTGTTAGLVVGQAITGTGIAAGAIISSIDSSNQITLSANSTASGTGIAATVFAGGARSTPTVTTTSGDPIVTFTTGTTAGLIVGQAISGTGIAPGAVITSIDSANQITVSANSTASGTGVAATVFARNSSVVPWAIGQSLTADLADANMGNTLVTYVAGTGFRPLDLIGGYSSYGSSVLGDNVRESLNADLVGLSGRTVNSLVLDNNAASVLNVTGAGAGQVLTNTSGAFLFTSSSTAASTPYSTIVGGFDDGIEVGGNEYVFSVANPSSAATTSTLTVGLTSPLDSVADITKSGRGTLVLSGTNTAGGGTRRTTINEGVLQIGGLASIGGTAGNLVFAGGTLRLGTGFIGDLSARTISFLNGGGTLDTNGNDVTLAGSLGSGVGGFTKVGAGNLTLNAAATYTGPTVLSAGTIAIGADNALGVGGDLTLAGGTTLALGSNSLSSGLVTMSGTAPVITGTGTITAANGFFFNNTTTDPATTDVNAVLAGAGGLRKAQANTLVLGGLSTYTGATEVLAGTLSINSIANVSGGASALGAPTTAVNGLIRMGLTTAETTLTYTGTGHSSNRSLGMQGTTGGLTLNANGSGAVGYGVVTGLTPGAKTLILDGSASGTLVNSIGGIVEGAATIALVKNGSTTWAITGTGTHSGLTSVNGGVLRISNSAALGAVTAGTVVADGATLQLEGGIAVGAEALTISGTGAAGQTGALVNRSGSNSFAGAITALSPLTISSEAGALTLGALTGADFGLTLAGAGDLSFGGDVQLGTGAITKNNTGLLALAGNNSFTGGLALNAGTVEAGSAGALGTTGSITFGGGTLRHGAGNTVDYSARFVSAPGTAYKIATAGQSVTYASPLSGVGSTLTKSGAGTLVLSAVNTFDGQTAVTGGVLSISSEDNLGAAPAAFTADQLLLDGGTLLSTASFAINDANRGITLGALGGTFNTAPSTQLTLDTALTGAGQLTKDGAGTVLLNVVSTHTGGTVVQDGKLLLGVNNAISGAVTVSGAGALDIGANNLTVSSLNVTGSSASIAGTGAISSAGGFGFSPTGTATISNVLAGSGGVTMSGTGTVSLKGANTYTGPTTISSGALLLDGGSIASTVPRSSVA